MSVNPHGNTDHSTPYMSLAGATYLRDVDAPPVVNVNQSSTSTPLDVTLPADYLGDGDVLLLEIYATSRLPSGGQQGIEFEVKHGTGDWQTLCIVGSPIFAGNPSADLWTTIRE